MNEQLGREELIRLQFEERRDANATIRSLGPVRWAVSIALGTGSYMLAQLSYRQFNPDPGAPGELSTAAGVGSLALALLLVALNVYFEARMLAESFRFMLAERAANKLTGAAMLYYGSRYSRLCPAERRRIVGIDAAEGLVATLGYLALIIPAWSAARGLTIGLGCSWQWTIAQGIAFAGMLPAVLVYRLHARQARTSLENAWKELEPNLPGPGSVPSRV